MSQLLTVEVVSEAEGALQADSYDYGRLPEELRDQAMLAQGTVLTKLGGAVERVIDAGNTLRWAKATLPYGEYLPWVQQACGLKPQRAAELIRAAEWVEMSGRPEVLSGVQSLDTLFLLSADATPDDVREWVMERCAAGNPPTRKEVQDRKRASQGRADRTVEQEALSALKLSAEARDLAAKAEHISSRQLMDALGVEELPKGKRHETAEAVYCRNGTGWWKLPIQQPVDLSTVRPAAEPQLQAELVARAEAAKRMGLKSAHDLSNRLTPSKLKRNGPPVFNGWEATPASHGKCYLRRVA